MSSNYSLKLAIQMRALLRFRVGGGRAAGRRRMAVFEAVLVYVCSA
jgi:hypothetical protein